MIYFIFTLIDSSFYLQYIGHKFILNLCIDAEKESKRVKKKKIEKDQESNLNQFIDYINQQEQSDRSERDKQAKFGKRKQFLNLS